ncbi:MAG TPA: PEP-CTERM sorting domain-containing protein [Candidatus Sulfopaludibacter sp.]|nr:PEP-CTERM sorting domain-containing protein [Candidatus Sulfopaludibacter sp.]
MKSKQLYLATALLISAPCLAAAGPLITPDPFGGAVAGPPGSSVGWGFTVQSDASDWVAFVASFPLFESNPSVGLYTDFIGAHGGPVNFALPPGAPDWIESFRPAAQTGLGSYTIAPSALPGAVDSGTIRILYQLYTGDPNTCGSCAAGTGSLDVPFQVTVNAAPEPGTWLLLAMGIGWLARRGLTS